MRKFMLIFGLIVLASCSPQSALPPSVTDTPIPPATPTQPIATVPPTFTPTARPSFTPTPVSLPTTSRIPFTATPRPTVTSVPPTPTPACTFIMPTINPYCGPHKSLQYSWFDQQAIPLTTTTSLRFSAQTDGVATSARLVLAAGGQIIPMTNRGNGLWDATLSPTQLTCSYLLGRYRYNHSFVGMLELFDGEVPETPTSLFINMIDGQISTVPVRWIDAQAQKTAHVVNLVMPNLDRRDPDVSQVTQKFYSYFKDDYDFLAVVYVPMRNENRFYTSVQNKTQGIGLALSNRTAQYGSAGRLTGIVQFPLNTYFDLGAPAASHELGHQWINFLAPALPVMQKVTPHWPISSLARGVMGYQCCGNPQGLDFPYAFASQPNGTWQLQAAGKQQTFNDLELYLMGLAPAREVAPHVIFPNQERELKAGETWTGALPFTVQEVIQAYGPRVPGYGVAPTKFRIATIVVSPSLLTPAEMALFDYFAARGSSKTELNYSEGHASGKTLPFYLATGKRGCLVTSLDEDSGC